MLVFRLDEIWAFFEKMRQFRMRSKLTSLPASNLIFIIHMGNFLTLNFWFNLRPGVFTGSSLKIILGFILLLIILAVVAGIGKKRWVKSLYAGLWQSLYYFFLTNAVIGLVLTFFNYEMTPFLSARFWLLLWVVSSVIWLFFIYRAIVKIPQRKARLEKEKEFNKYIP